MSCICKIKHNSPDCESDKGLQIFYDHDKNKYSGYCFSCAARGKDAYVKDPYDGEHPSDPPPKKTGEEIEAEIAEVRALQYPNFDYRGIPMVYFKRSGVKLAISEYDGKTPFSFNFPLTRKGKHIGYEARPLPFKGFWRIGKTEDIRDCDLFNWEMAKKKGVKRLYVTEGAYDCLSLEYMLESTCGGKYKYAVTSVPNGAESAVRTLGRMREEILQLFDEVVLVFDNDEAGKLAIENVQKVFPEVLTAPHIANIKDANEALEKNQAATFCDFVIWKSRKPTIKGVVTVQEILEKGDPKPEMGIPYPWDGVTEVTYGKRWGETTCISGAVGSGKTLLVHEDAAYNIFSEGIPCFAILLEEKNVKTIRNIAGKKDSLAYNKPEVYENNKDQFYETTKYLEDKLFLWNSSASREARFNIESILGAIRYNALEYGCKFGYIDNMTKLVDSLSTSEANEFINRYSSEIESLSAELDIHIFLLSHLNPPKGKDAISHESGGEVLPGQLTGSRGIMRSFPNLIGFERNKYADGDRQNNSFISIIKNRDYGGEKKIKTKYNPVTGRLLQFNWDGDSLY